MGQGDNRSYPEKCFIINSSDRNYIEYIERGWNSLGKNNQSTQEMNSQVQNPLGIAPVGGLIAKFAIPAIISMLVSAMYNIVDQIFIGQGVGMLGNAATNVAFPVTTIATALALLLGIGGASNYNLEMGAGYEEKPVGLQVLLCHHW